MINFDGAILIDIMSMSGPETSVENVDGVEAYKHVLLSGDDRLGAVCEGCGRDDPDPALGAEEAPPLPMYRSVGVWGTHYTTPTIDYCQVCMESLKSDYDEDPYRVSAHGRIPGAEWWQPVFMSGHEDGVWKNF